MCGVATKSGNSWTWGTIREFYFQSAKIRGRIIIFWKIREVIELLFFHFKEVTFSILSHTFSWLWQLPSFPFFIAFSSVQSFWSAVVHFMKPAVWTAKNRVNALPSPTSVERNGKNIKENQGEMSSISQKISGKIRKFCLNIAVATLYVIYSKCHPS